MPHKKSPMNIREFAKLCGHSPSTISRVLNNPFERARASGEVYDKIRARAAEVGFKLNYHAKAMHSNVSDCIGFIAGSYMHLLCGEIQSGIASALKPRRKLLSVYTCENSTKGEAAAFEEMFYSRADAIVYVPAMQPAGAYKSAHIRNILKKHPNHPPIVTVYGGLKLPSLHQICFRDYETGKSAALRQLKLGCKKFGIIDSYLTCPANIERMRGYRRTLISNGVSEKNIRQISVLMPENPNIFDELKGVDGIWSSYYIILLMSSYGLNNIGNPKKLHIDCVSGDETDLFCSAIERMATSHMQSASYKDAFGSLVLHKFSLKEIGERAAEMALRICAEKPKLPQIEHLEFTAEHFQRHGA